MSTAATVVRPGFQWHTRGSWSAREDRRPSLVWLGLIWIGMIAGFGLDGDRFRHEVPAPGTLIYVHAAVFTVWLLILTAQVLLVVSDRVAIHRKLGWFAAAWACVMLVLGPWAAMVAKGPLPSGPGSPQFLSVQFGDISAFAVLLLWGITLRKNPAAHKRVMILATVAIVDPGYARLANHFIAEPHSTVMWFVSMFYGNVMVIALMAAWDAWRGRLMKQFAVGAVGLLSVECLQAFLYHWGPWRSFTIELLAAWGRHFG
ncbi:MAG TPA: hypothetical protein VN612_05110 [Acidobacteriaceae bacterium]|nr:hypothetical protein [Acidobacteriaceae bacterium]